MKKRILSVLIVLAVVCALFAIPADAKANVTKVWFEGDNVAVRAGADLSLLCDNKILSDENAEAKDFNKEGIVLIQNTNMHDTENLTRATMYIELDSLQNIDSVYITWYVFYNAIIALPDQNTLIIGYSADGENYNEIGAYTFEGEADPETSSQLETTIRLGQTVKAKYVSVSFEFGPYDEPTWYCPVLEWVGFTEVGAGVMSDEVLDGGYDEVSQDNTPLDQIDPIVEIPEGHVALKHAKFNESITTGSYTIITDPATMQDFNVKWTSCALIRPTETEGVYEVVAVEWVNGSETFVFADAAEGDMVLSVHGDDDTDGTKANRLALNALVPGDTVTFAGYDFAEQSFERGAVVYFIDNTAAPDNGEASEEPSDDVSEEPSDESEPAEESEEDTSVPATNNSDAASDKEDGGNTGLIIGIVVAVIAAAAVVVVIVVVKKKK